MKIEGLAVKNTDIEKIIEYKDSIHEESICKKNVFYFEAFENVAHPDKKTVNITTEHFESKYVSDLVELLKAINAGPGVSVSGTTSTENFKKIIKSETATKLVIESSKTIESNEYFLVIKSIGKELDSPNKVFDTIPLLQ